MELWYEDMCNATYYSFHKQILKVARGDLGVEIPQESLSLVQKEIVRKTNYAGKPVIVATQMLDSMQKNPRPTRAECTDVSNAVFDGADCVMLSGESAKGKYPVQSVATMKRIVDESELYLNGKNVRFLPGQDRILRQLRSDNKPTPISPRESIADSIVNIASGANAACVIVICESGSLVKSISKFRPGIPVYCAVKNAKQGRQLQVYHGLHPFTWPDVPSVNRSDASISRAKTLGLCKTGDKIVVVEGRPRSTELAAGFKIEIVTVL
jgi:pyruvate kinase